MINHHQPIFKLTYWGYAPLELPHIPTASDVFVLNFPHPPLSQGRLHASSMLIPPPSAGDGDIHGNINGIYSQLDIKVGLKMGADHMATPQETDRKPVELGRH